MATTNSIILLLIGLGLGVLVGFYTFQISYESECHHLLMATQQEAVDRAQAEVRLEMDEIRFHNQALKSQLQQQTEKCNLEQQHLTEQVQQLQSSLEEALTAVSSSVAPTEPPPPSSSSVLISEFKQVLQRRAFAQTILKYGQSVSHEDTVIQVELTVDFGQSVSQLETIILQIDHLKEMPMTTATCLYLLVEAGLYTGTSLRPLEGKENEVLQMTNLPDNRRSQAMARWEAHGFSPESPLLWTDETSVRQAPCQRYGLGMDWNAQKGGDIFIHLGLPTATTRPCLGRVVEGVSWLNAQTHGTLAHARVVSSTTNTATRHREL